MELKANDGVKINIHEFNEGIHTMELKVRRALSPLSSSSRGNPYNGIESHYVNI
jgi:hypothetical protein